MKIFGNALVIIGLVLMLMPALIFGGVWPMKGGRWLVSFVDDRVFLALLFAVHGILLITAGLLVRRKKRLSEEPLPELKTICSSVLFIALFIGGLVGLNALDIAAAADGGIWAVDGEQRLRIGPDGTALLRNDALGGWRIAGDGTWVTEGFSDILVGRYGPAGEQRVIALREDGTILGLDGDGSPALRIQLEDEIQPYIAAGDLDGDGQDELLVSSKDRGVATVEMEIP